MQEAIVTQYNILLRDMVFPEGPAFDAQGGLWCVELQGGNLVRYGDGGAVRYPTGGAPNGLAFDEEGRACFCDAEQCAVRRFDPETKSICTLADHIDGKPLFKPNDLAFDGGGNLVFTNPGDSRTEPTGYVCCLRPDGTLDKIADEMYFPNGLCFAKVDGKLKLIIAETYKQRLWIGDWNASLCSWLEPHPFVSVGGAPGPDGMALGTNGLLYVAVYGAGRIKVIELGGKIVDEYDLPGANPTNCAFDPKGKLGLVVTEAQKGLLLSLPEIKAGPVLF